ncbi:hypothetical protein [Bacillus sp. Marseille-Q1617]|uniref:hypothetical protein n=1 Tax=Bacillus sp. Marseille-Q1617 TaxID=2736887 RepID=UPI00158D0BD9|nr:hypothetical protein [Bacillus sp. Marseille-Q1617]
MAGRQVCRKGHAIFEEKRAVFEEKSEINAPFLKNYLSEQPVPRDVRSDREI